MIERRKHRRYKLPDAMALVRVPESAMDHYFHVANLSLKGLALVAESTDGFPIREQSVLDMELHVSLGVIQCRGVVARVIMEPAADDEPRGYGVQIYGFGAKGKELWMQIINELAQEA